MCSDGESRKLWSLVKLSGFDAKVKSGLRIVLNIDGVEYFPPVYARSLA